MSIFSQHSRRFGKPFDSAQGRGFTLIELLVVGAIIIIITSLFLLRQSKFDSTTILRSLAYSITLSMRQAQVYGVSVQATSTFSGVVYASGYGLYFTAVPNNIYLLFADINNNGRYDAGEDVQAFTLNNGYRISEICAINALKNCSAKPDGMTDDSTNSPTISNLSVIFRRPNHDACISTDVAPGVCGQVATQTFSTAYIQISSKGDPSIFRSITVSNTGAIETQRPNKLP
ncbi:MAG: hypothetical protein Q7S26_04545 [bacterium]|nr:hypothetical protein [bacterium]